MGFGFHRYSTDQSWLVPHFEKMLYDQALLALAYLEAFQATGNAEYADTAREIFTYVLRDMTDPEGPFYSAEDADSEGVEGRFYVWSEQEIRDALDAGPADLVIRSFQVLPSGNWVDPTGHGDRREQHTPHEKGDRRSIRRNRTHDRVAPGGVGRGAATPFCLARKTGPPPQGRQGIDRLERTHDSRPGPGQLRCSVSRVMQRPRGRPFSSS